MNNSIEKVKNYIKDSWMKAVKPKDCIPGFPLPYDYIPPCVAGDLTNLYYWDTYFTNKGLLLDRFGEYAKNNIEVLKYCLDKFGCVPNMCRANGADYNSQPPLLFLMVKDYYEHSKDLHFLKSSYESLKKEYDFWMTKRISENGLNQYGFNYNYMNKPANADYFAERIGLDISTYTKEEVAEFCENMTAECESGEDFTPRFFKNAKYVNPIDLNTLLYAFELTMSEFACELGCGEGAFWENQADKRKALLTEYCFDRETGLYFDYDFREGKKTKVYCVACYLPFIFGLTKDKKSIDRLNEKLLFDFGVASCEKQFASEMKFQWGYPNAWAPHQYWGYLANKTVENTEIALQIARSFLNNVSCVFEREGKLYEKYDAEIGGKANVNEYGLPEMLGWTAGVFNYFYCELSDL